MPAAEPHVIPLSEPATLLAAIVVMLLAGLWRARSPTLQRLDLPDAVVGGLAAALLLWALRQAAGLELQPGRALRDLMLLAFFASIGLSARLALLRQGGRALVVLCAVSVLAMVLQNLAGLAVARAFDLHPFHGLLAGALSFVGGPGTALAWAQEAEAAGVPDAALIGLGSATLAVMSGALLAAPTTRWMIERRGLQAQRAAALAPAPAAGAAERAAPASDLPQRIDAGPPMPGSAAPVHPVASHRHESLDDTAVALLRSIALVAACVLLGQGLVQAARAVDVMLPGFLAALLAGVLVANLAELLPRRWALPDAELPGTLALRLFLAITLMSLPLSHLGGLLGPLLVNLAVQLLLILALAWGLLFPLLGRSYDAAVATGGFLGYAVASMPVALATMRETVRQHGPAPRALLWVTLAGSFFVDLANAAVAKAFLMWPLLRLAP